MSQETCRQPWSHANRVGRGCPDGCRSAELLLGVETSFAVTCHCRRPRPVFRRPPTRTLFTLSSLSLAALASAASAQDRSTPASAIGETMLEEISVTAETAAAASPQAAPAASAGYVGGTPASVGSVHLWHLPVPV